MACEKLSRLPHIDDKDFLTRGQLIGKLGGTKRPVRRRTDLAHASIVSFD
jgi:hypothetical protein